MLWYQPSTPLNVATGISILPPRGNGSIVWITGVELAGHLKIPVAGPPDALGAHLSDAALGRLLDDAGRP